MDASSNLLSDLINSIPWTTPFVAPEALERKLGVTFSLRLGANESLFGPSPGAIRAIQDSVGDSSLYGDPQSTDLKRQIADQLSVGPDQILISSGIDEALSLWCRAFLNPGDRSVTTLGSYPTFEFAVTAAGGAIERVAYRDFSPDLKSLANKARERGAKLVYLANPDNPSGKLVSRDAVQALRDELPEGCVLLLDEAYADFVTPEGLLPFDLSAKLFIRMRTFSKAHGLAGLRVAYSVGPAEWVQSVDKIRMHFGVSRVAQAAALASLGSGDHLSNVIQETNLGRERLSQMVEKFGPRPLESSTNFVTFSVGVRSEAERLLNAFLQNGVFIRKPASGELEGCIRITIGRERDLNELEKRLLAIFQNARL